MEKQQSFENEIEEIRLENITLKTADQSEPILQSVDFSLPTDQVLVIESSHPNHALLFLKLLAGRLDASSGQILWNDEDVFTQDSDKDPRDNMGCYFENYRAGKEDTLVSLLSSSLNQDDLQFVLDYFELNEKKKTSMMSLPYSYQKLAYLIKCASGEKQILVLEDPASGLEEDQWLCFLDYIQLRQRRGHLRHVFMTNHHPTALRHLGHNRIFIEDGLIYFDEQAGYKKVSHF